LKRLVSPLSPPQQVVSGTPIRGCGNCRLELLLRVTLLIII